MENKGIDEFGKTLIQTVRDPAIENCDSLMNPAATHAKSRRWIQAAEDKNVKQLLEVIIPDIVDETIYYLLHAIDSGELKLNFQSSEGKIINLEDDGMRELAGWYADPQEWINQYSRERFNDYISD